MKDFIYATGCPLQADAFSEHKEFCYRLVGLKNTPEEAGNNTDMINEWVEKASSNGKKGGTVVIPKGTYPVYTIRMKSYVTLFLEEGAVLWAAKPTEERGYDEPEVNLYAGIQDHGHTYLANSLIYGTDLEDVEIAGSGMLCGVEALERWDPEGNEDREKNGHKGIWNGNKGIALRRCKNVILRDFSFLCGGHFALLLSACKNVLASDVIVDTERDAFDIDGCENVTVCGGWYNSPNDDALCLKADYGAGGFYPVRNVILRDTTVSGFDAGSVINHTYTGNQMIAADRCRPTGRIKFGTEASCGCDTIYAKNVRFLRSRGFCMESCDGAEMHDILMEDCSMEEVSSSPVFIRVGSRDRFPVTGFHKDGNMYQETSVRLSEQEWVLPDTELYEKHPAKRFSPCYNRDRLVETEEGTQFYVVDPQRPCKINRANVAEKDGHFYGLKWEAGSGYSIDESMEIQREDLPLYANAIGAQKLASCWNILIRRLKVKDADPRYPILVMGLSDSKIRDISFEDVEIEYRGGLTLQDAAEQRQINTRWAYKNYRGETEVQILPWMVNTFFTKNEALLPRYDWSEKDGKWIADPYNVPEMPHMYPEPSNWGVLPAYGIYARHVENLSVSGMNCSVRIPDERHFCVLDDVHGVKMEHVKVWNPEVVLVSSSYRRPTGKEYVPEMPYHREEVTDYKLDEKLKILEVKVPAPAPGTPSDSLYPLPTLPVKENGFCYPENQREKMLRPLIYRPYLVYQEPVELSLGKEQNIQIEIRNPAENTWVFENQEVDVKDWLGNQANVEMQAADLAVRAFLVSDGEKQEELEVREGQDMTYGLSVLLKQKYKETEKTYIQVEITDQIGTEYAKIYFRINGE